MLYCSFYQFILGIILFLKNFSNTLRSDIFILAFAFDFQITTPLSSFGVSNSIDMVYVPLYGFV